MVRHRAAALLRDKYFRDTNVADVTASIANDVARLPAGSVIIVDDFHTAASAVSKHMIDLVEWWPAETA